MEKCVFIHILLQYTAVRLDLAEKKEHISVGTFLFSEL